MTSPPGTPPRTLTIAGSDSGGGAGIQADLRTFFACGVHGMTAITAVTVQNSLGVSGFHTIPPEVVAAQIEAVATDIGVQAAKTGMLATAEIIEAIAGACERVRIGRSGDTPFVVDPVSASMHGDPLLSEAALDALRTLLFPVASLVTPNLDEVRLLTGIEVRSQAQQRDAAKALAEFGPQWVLVKGGHLFDDAECLDLLYDGSQFHEFVGPRYDAKHTHGSGDTLASTVTSALAKGLDMVSAVGAAKSFIQRSVLDAYPLGAGVGPVSPRWRLPDWDTFLLEG
ncbi:hydroxymethylpyrimidine/phosphomethylpyrimidine kinase [Actinokineospora baliensis]|uniref:bifunctional hydroxymethylpyrimidine kinase/phosphomethylpyrimidine kinase n=1 Tax=Actinokineospora baliensis TaxID=547056 RepID=UPI00195F0BAD|nr:bifunctional hydroxymethylpyrimidine kinase/phosphomethylpyrimidine kinase [Actinokineospora baliensis]MBM7771535.1 hydroxymethylpyrimidine/phosphomethylpyrimidine kinase [Actinokineospora baliensis]